MHTHQSILNPHSIDIATSLDVNADDVDRTANKGLVAEPQTSTSKEYDKYIDDGDPNGFVDPDGDFNT